MPFVITSMEIGMSSDSGRIYRVNLELLSNEPVDFEDLRRFLEGYENDRIQRYNQELANNSIADTSIPPKNETEEMINDNSRVNSPFELLET